MQLRIYPQEDGTVNVLAKKTRHYESHSVLTRGIRPENLERELRKTIQAARGEAVEEE